MSNYSNSFKYNQLVQFTYSATNFETWIAIDLMFVFISEDGSDKFGHLNIFHFGMVF